MAADFDSVPFDIGPLAQVCVVSTVPFEVADLSAEFASLAVHWKAAAVTWCMSR